MIKALIVGLGNPGSQYVNTPHNVGFSAVEQVARLLGVHTFALDKKFLAATLKINDILLVKPETYMNNSGQAVGSLMQYYRVTPGNLFVVHDDFDISLGKLKVSLGKSGSNHAGVLSIEEAVKSNAFARFRLGIGKPRIMTLEHYVLTPFSSEDQQLVDPLTTKAAQAVVYALTHGIDKTMTQFNAKGL